MTRLSLPAQAKIRASNFDLQRVQGFNPLRGGNHQTVDLGEPLWSCDIETTELSREQGGVWKALRSKLRGMARTLKLYDASRPRPLAYHAEADAAVRIGRGVRIGEFRRIGCPTRAWGDPVIVELDRAGSRVRIDRAAPSAEFSEGDYGAWDDGATRRLFHIVEAAEAKAGGCWLTVEPAPPASSENLPAPFEMHCAAAEFVVLQSRAPYSAPVTQQVTLQAVQTLRRSEA